MRSVGRTQRAKRQTSRGWSRRGSSGQLRSIAAIARPYRHVYVSPHFDDAALSAGGVILLQKGRCEPVLVISVFTARPRGNLTRFAEFQHDRWGGAADPWEEREEEERAAMAALGADFLWLDYPDAIYRGDQYLSDADLFGPVKDGDAELQRALSEAIVGIWRRCPSAMVYLPLGVGNHVDHQLCHGAGLELGALGADVAYYEDHPYAMDARAVATRLRDLGDGVRPVSIEIGRLVEEKVRIVELYRSQVAWVFRHYGTARDAITRHAASVSMAPGGSAERLWRADGRGQP